MAFPLAFDPGLFWVLFGLTVLTMLALRHINRPLRSKSATCGIISLELANLDRATLILEEWDVRVRMHAAMGLGFDYLFLALYGTTIALGCVKSGEVLSSASCPIHGFAPWLAWGAWLAALLDAIENAALWRMLRTAPSARLTALARGSAIPKFVLIGITLLYVVAGLAAWILS